MMRIKAVFWLLVVAVIASACSRGGAMKSGSAKIGIEAPWSVTYLPTAITIDRMKEKGYQVEAVMFDSPETMTQALQNDQINIGSTSAGTIFAAIEAGLPAKAFLGLNRNNFVMASKAQLSSCESLDGKRVGIHSHQGTTGTLTKVWFATTCPNAKPNIIVVPGSENRVAGLLADQLDATALDVPSAVQLLKKRPDDFKTIDSFGNLDIVASMFYAKSSWLQANRQLAKDFADTYVAVVNEANQDSAALIKKGREIIPEMDAQVLDEVVKAWLERKIWAPAAALEEKAVAFTLSFHQQSTKYSKISGPADVVDASFVK